MAWPGSQRLLFLRILGLRRLLILRNNPNIELVLFRHIAEETRAGS